MGESRSQGAFVGFAPGDAVALVGRRTVALVVDDPRSALVTDLRDAIRSDADLDLLTAILVGAGLRSLPPLALVQFEGTETRSILRGDIVLTVQHTSGAPPEDSSGGDVLTWVEHVAAEVASLDIRREGETAELSVYEIAEGVVPAARLEVRLAQIAVQSGPEPSRADPEPSRADDVNDPAEGAAGPAEAGALEQAGDPVVPSAVVPLDGASGAPENGSVTPAGPVRANETARYPELRASGDAPPPGPESSTDQDRPCDSMPVGGPTAQDGDLDDPDLTIMPGQSPEHGAGAGDDADTDDDDDADDDYDHLFGATEHRPVSLAGVDEDAAEPVGSHSSEGLISSIPGIGEPPVASSPPPVESGPVSASSDDPGVEVGDHDGMTISLAQLKAARGGGEQTLDPLTRPPADRSRGEVVHAVSCPSGHLNPPAAASCRVCGVEIAAQEHVSVPRPVLGVLRFSSGDEYPLARSMLMGRSPKASGTSEGSQLPELITLESPSKELSGTHLEIRLEGWQVLAIDRRSTNGTTVALPGREPQRLHPGNAVPIVPGTVIDMAEEIQFTYEVTP